MKQKVKIKKELIDKYKNDLPCNFNNKLISLETNSHFKIHKYTSNSVDNNFHLDDEIYNKNNLMKCMKVIMSLNDKQKKIMKNWMCAYTKMYNESLHYLKTQIKSFQILNEKNIKNLTKDDKKKISFMNLRNSLKNVRDNIKKTTDINGKTIYTHTLDKSIDQLCTNINNSIDKLKNGIIKHFRIHYWKQTRPSQTIDIEKTCFDKQHRLGYKVFGDIQYFYNNENYKLENIKHDVKINYNKITNQFTLLIPKDVKINNVKNENNVISLDPGLRTIMTGVCENYAVKIGVGINKKIKKIVNKIKNIKNNNNIQLKNKKKGEQKYENKIYNLVDDLHWKSIKYLTNNYNNILLGDMSAKSIISKNNLQMRKDMKDACERTRYYQFRQRLIYKCNVNNIQFRLVDEKYTSKTCSICGNVNEKLKGEEIYDCKNCGIKIDRDINACRNIYIKQQEFK
jgi:IS605 OrfB family transposase